MAGAGSSAGLFRAVRRRRPPTRQTPIAVTVATVAMADIADTFEAGGVVQARTTATIMARILAPVREVRVAPGDRVRAGQVLIVLDGRDLAAHARSARAAALAADQGVDRRGFRATGGRRRPRAGARHPRAHCRSARQAIGHGAGTRRRHRRACARPKRAPPARPPGRKPPCQASTAHAPPATRQTRRSRSRSSRRPSTDVVTEKMVEPGNMAAPGTPLMRLEDTRGFRLDVRVDESRIGQIAPGAIVPVSLDSGTGGAADDRQRHGGGNRPRGRCRRARVSRQDRAARCRRVCARGCSAGRTSAARPRRALTVPADALVHRGQMTSVFVVENGIARVRLVNVSGTEVLAGLSEGEVVIVAAPAGGDRRPPRHGRRPLMAASYGAAGRLAAAFIHSKLTPLFIVASMALGALAVVALPREEEPQIIVPMVDVFVEMPGATPADVEQRVTRPMEQLLWEVPGVEYVYSTSSAGQSMVVVRFKVGEAARSGARPAQSEARGQCRSHPARRHRPHRQAPLDRRRADPGRDRVVGALRRRPAAGAGRAAARRHRRSHRRVRGDAHRRATASAAGGRRSGAARGLRTGPARRSAGDRRDQRARRRVGARRRAGRSPASKRATGCGRPTRFVASWSAPRAAVPCSSAIWPRSWTAMPSPRRMSPISRARRAPTQRSRSPWPSARAPTPSTSRIT